MFVKINHEAAIALFEKDVDIYNSDKALITDILDYSIHDQFFINPEDFSGSSAPAGMTGPEYLEFLRQLFDDMMELITKKNRDYTAGGSAFANFDSASDFGIDRIAGLGNRMGDKFKRIQTFCKLGKLEVENEGLEDAFKDLIGYSCLGLGMLEAEKRRK